MSKISVIVPVYNTERYLPCCLDSILNQSFIDFELLLVDDGSTDGSSAICDVYAEKDSRIRVFHKENGGVSSARNLGLENAKGDWVCFVDSDDELLPEGLQTMVDEFSEEVDMVMAGYCELEEGTVVTDTSGFRKKGTIDRNESLMMMFLSDEVYMGYSIGKLYKRSFVERKDLSFDENITVKEDTLFVVEYLCCIQKLVGFTSTPVYKYKKRPAGVMGGLRHSYNLKFLTSFDAVVKMNEQIQGLSQVNRSLSEAAKYEVVNRIYLIYAHMLENGAVDKKALFGLKKRAIDSVGLCYYLKYQYWRNKRRTRNLLKRKLKLN